MLRVRSAECSLQDLNQRGCHVVGTDTVLRILGEDFMQHLADKCGRFCGALLLEFVCHFVGAFLIGQAIPDAIARVDDELVILRAPNDLYVRCRSHRLLTSVKIRLVFVLKIADGSAERQVSVDALVADEVIRVVDTLLLVRVVGLVVLGELDDDLTFLDEDGAAIARVGTVDVLGSDEHDAACAAGILRVIFLRNLLVDIQETV